MNIFLKNCMGILHWKRAGIFGEFFLVSVSWKTKQGKLLEKFGENSEQNSGQNSGRKFEKFGALSFCTFSDLTTGQFWITASGSYHPDGNGCYSNFSEIRPASASVILVTPSPELDLRQIEHQSMETARHHICIYHVILNGLRQE